MSVCFIYGLIDPRTGLVRYVGKTAVGMRRPQSHRTPCILRADQTHKGRWIRQLVAEGLLYVITVLEEVEVNHLSIAERSWIARGRELGWPLTNSTDGGEGLSGHVFSPEHRQRISCANKGRRLTEAQRARIASARRGKPLSLAAREKLREAGRHARLGTKHTAEAKARVGAANSKEVVCTTTGMYYPSLKKAASENNLSVGSLLSVLKGRQKQTKGLKFCYAPEVTA